MGASSSTDQHAPPADVAGPLDDLHKPPLLPIFERNPGAEIQEAMHARKDSGLTCGFALGDTHMTCGVHIFDDPQSHGAYVVPMPLPQAADTSWPRVWKPTSVGDRGEGYADWSKDKKLPDLPPLAVPWDAHGTEAWPQEFDGGLRTRLGQDSMAPHLSGVGHVLVLGPACTLPRHALRSHRQSRSATQLRAISDTAQRFL
mmetsp:Transcript_111819/g.176599  ORF Transcript_111819/g.176599 Transcript_111819/m.176599 type:complete len:201 (-) Transcript_111819:6-608(-)